MKKSMITVLVASALAGCGTSDVNSQFTQQSEGQHLSHVPLRQLAAPLNLKVGAALETRHLDNPQFRTTLAREFSQITPENEMKFQYVQPEQGVFDFSKPDRLVEFAEQHDITVKGHALIWHIQNPQWLEEKEWTQEELTQVME